MCYSTRFYIIGNDDMDVHMADAEEGKLFYVI